MKMGVNQKKSLERQQNIHRDEKGKERKIRHEKHPFVCP